MKALVINEPGKTALVDREVPRPNDGEVLLKVGRAGLCGSDLSTYRGLNPLVSYPRIPGHELGCTIVEITPGVPEKLAVGTDILVLPYTNCGTCSACRRERPNCCKNNQTLGVQRDGGMAEFLAVPWQKVLMAPGLSLAELALVEPLTVGFHAVDRGRVASADTVVVLGCGAIGLGAIAGAAERGARVVAVDLDAKKLALAGRAGAAETIRADSLHGRLQELTRDEGADVVIEAIGLPATFRAAVEEVGFAGRVVYIGYAKTPVEYETKLFVQKELDILGSRNATTTDFENVIRVLQARRFPVDGVITKAVRLSDAGEALDAWSKSPQDTTKIQVGF